MTKKYPRILSKGAHNTVIVISETEVAKLFTGDTRSDIGSEADKLKYANKVNDLVAKFKRLDVDDLLDVDMLVMERIYPLDFRSFEFEKRELIFDVFENQLESLHKAGFVHPHISRNDEMPDSKYDNILLTQKGLRLIDVGISAIKDKVGDRLFNRFIDQEKKEIEEFREYFLNR